MRRISSASFGVSVILVCTSVAHSGEVVITACNPGSDAQVYWSDDSGISGTTTTDVNGDGDMADAGETVSIPNEDKVTSVVVCRDLGFDSQMNPITTWTELLLQPTILFGAEPVDVPTVKPAPSTPPGKKIAPQIDVPSFKDSGISFVNGQILTVTNGAIAQASSIHFKDATGVPDSSITQLFDASFVNSLPNFNGDVIVTGPIHVQRPVPAMSQCGNDVLTGAVEVTGRPRTGFRKVDRVCWRAPETFHRDHRHRPENAF